MLLIKSKFQFHTTWVSFFVVLAIVSIGNNNTAVDKLIARIWEYVNISKRKSNRARNTCSQMIMMISFKQT